MKLELHKTESPYRYEVYFGMSHLGYFYTEIDGFWVFSVEQQGYWNEFSLRMIADKLEEMNKPYNEEIELHFENQK
jgi:hypothetical protein